MSDNPSSSRAMNSDADADASPDTLPTTVAGDAQASEEDEVRKLRAELENFEKTSKAEIAELKKEEAALREELRLQTKRIAELAIIQALSQSNGPQVNH